MAIKVKSVAAMSKDTLEAISKQDITVIGNLLLSAVEEIEHLHTECGIDQSKVGDDGLIDFEHNTTGAGNNDSAYEALLNEYQNRFSGEYNNSANTTKADTTTATPPAADTVAEPEPINIFETEGE